MLIRVAVPLLAASVVASSPALADPADGLPSEATGEVALGLARDRLVVVITGAAAQRIDTAMTGARTVKVTGAGGGQWRKGKQIGCRVQSGAAECRFEVTRSGQVLAPASWADAEPGGGVPSGG